MFSFYVNVKTVVNGVEHQNGSSLPTMMADARELFNEHGETVTGEVVLMSGKDIFYSPLGQPTVEEFVLIEKSFAKDFAFNLCAHVNSHVEDGVALDSSDIQAQLTKLFELI